MFRKMSYYGGMLLLCGAAILAMPSAGWAAHGGGGGHFAGGAHFGGVHFGGGYLGGAHFGAYHSGLYGGNHYGFPNSGFHAGYGYRGYHYPRYGYYGYYPYSYLGYSGYPDPWVEPGYSSWYSSGGGYETPADTGSQSYDPSDLTIPSAPAVKPDNTAHVSLKVPADAEVWFDQTRTHSTGAVRQFQSPALDPLRVYTYEVRARWNDKGHEISQTQQVEVTAGEHLNVTFPVPSKAAGNASVAGGK